MTTIQLTGSLEDYLETIYLLVRERGYARVKDIAKARKVKAGSVTPALKRLDEAGLVEYVQREYVKLTEKGSEEARKVLAKHSILKRFFEEVLRMTPEDAERESCAMEHSLSADAMDRLVRFFEYLAMCPGGLSEWLEKFHDCLDARENGGGCNTCPEHANHAPEPDDTRKLANLEPGRSGVVMQVAAGGAIRQRLIDMGFLPGAKVKVERLALGGDPLWVSIQGSQLALRRSEAENILVTA